MGLFPVRLHSEHSVAGAAQEVVRSPRRLGAALTRALARARTTAATATNDARVVGLLLVLAAAALAVEMAVNFRAI
jgi:hypothetical protein